MTSIVAGTSLASGILKGVGSIMAGNAQAKAARFNSAMAFVNAQRLREDAANAIAEGVANEGFVRERARAAIGEQLAAQGGSGFEMGTGSALDALKESQINSTLDALQVRREAQVRSRELIVEANNQMLQGVMGGMQAKSARSSGLFGAASALVDAVGNFAGAGGFGGGASK